MVFCSDFAGTSPALKGRTLGGSDLRNLPSLKQHFPVGMMGAPHNGHNFGIEIPAGYLSSSPPPFHLLVGDFGSSTSINLVIGAE